MDEIVRVDENTLAPIGDSIIQAAEQAEKRIEAVIKIKKLCFRVCNSHDFVDMQGKPYLSVSGAEKVANLFGISWRVGEPVYEVEPDGHYSYTYSGVFIMGNREVDAIGVRSSKDPFFKRYSYQDGERVELPVSEIDKGDVKKAGYTNCLGNGVSRILGIRGLSWEELEVAGIKREDSASVKYGKKEDQNVNSDVSAKRQEHNRRIQEALIRLYGGDKKAMAEKIVELTTWTPNKGANAGKEQRGQANYLTIKSDQSVAILCSKLEKLSPVPKEPEETMCSECRKSITKGECTCPGQEPPE